jgi:hypothetical protein
MTGIGEEAARTQYILRGSLSHRQPLCNTAPKGSGGEVAALEKLDSIVVDSVIGATASEPETEHS